jgi:hypothetical protein
MRNLISIILLTTLLFLADIKTVVKIESCAAIRCRVIFSDGSTDLLINPFIGQKVIKK